jgi:hypothetical protein
VPSMSVAAYPNDGGAGGLGGLGSSASARRLMPLGGRAGGVSPDPMRKWPSTGSLGGPPDLGPPEKRWSTDSSPLLPTAAAADIRDTAPARRVRQR